MKKKLFAGAAVLLSVCMVAGMLGGCTTDTTQPSSSAATQNGSNSGQATQALNVVSDKVKDEDLDASWDEVNSTGIAFEGDAVSVKGEGAVAEGAIVTISKAGTYLLTGTGNDMQVVINAPEDALVRLVLNGVSLHSEDSAPINCEQADKLLVILADGTQNNLTDGEKYTFPDAGTDEPSAALFSKADLTFNGTGTLVVEGNYNNGIGTKDDLIIVSGEIRVKAANHAIRGRDSVTVLDGALTLDAGNDGIQTNNDSAEDKGWIELYGGTYNIAAAHDGIQAISTLTIIDGEYNITAGGGAANAEERAQEEFPGGGGFPGQPPEGGGFPGQDNQSGETQVEQDTAQADTLSAQTGETTSGSDSTSDTTSDAAVAEDSTSDSCKGIKATGNLTIQGGSFTMDCADDAFHSNANLTVSGGEMTLKTGDDGYHADTDLLVEGDAVIKVTECYEGLEGATVTIKGGDIDIVASDDGINAAGGSDASEGNGGFGQDMFTANDNYVIDIQGGVIRLDAGNDGLDSNGHITISGGEFYATGSTQGGGEGAIDCNGNVTFTGGTVVAAGGAAFAIIGQSSNNINGSGSQPVLSFYFSNAQEAGTVVELKDADGKTLASYTPDKSYSNVAFTTADMKDGQSYTVCANGSEAGTVTLSGMFTSVSDTGEAVSGGMQGWPGGMPGNQNG